MTKLLLFVVVCFYSIGIFAQNSKKQYSNGINTCAGAVNIFENGDYTLQFTGEKSKSSIQQYSALDSVTTDNQLWVSYIASAAGELTFRAEKKSGYIQMVVFDQMKKEICSEISAGISEISRMYIKRDSRKVGVNHTTGDGLLFTLKLHEGQKINILFATEKENDDKFHLKWNFDPETLLSKETKIIDRRFDDFAPTFSIKVRDENTKEPLVASISIEESKNEDGLYVASDLFLNIERKTKMKIKCDVEGYFFKDSLIDASSFDDQHIEIPLNRISSGQSVKIEDIEFRPGTSEITSGSEPKLNRLKDFLLLNADLKIEIQGHVFALGENSMMGQKISEARAKRVRKFLIDNGIDKNRLTSKGYGNTSPVYKEPKFSYEEQANRRVEILVL